MDLLQSIALLSVASGLAAMISFAFWRVRMSIAKQEAPAT